MQIDIRNAYLRELLCGLIEDVPEFAFTGAASVTAVAGDCCTWSNVRVALGVIALNGTLSLCISGEAGAAKTILLSGDFRYDTPLVNIAASFTLTLDLQLDGTASITGLRIVPAPISVDAKVGLGAEAHLLRADEQAGLPVFPSARSVPVERRALAPTVLI